MLCYYYILYSATSLDEANSIWGKRIQIPGGNYSEMLFMYIVHFKIDFIKMWFTHYVCTYQNHLLCMAILNNI